MGSDDIASLVRYLLYTNELDTLGIIYSSSKQHSPPVHDQPAAYPHVSPWAPPATFPMIR